MFPSLTFIIYVYMLEVSVSSEKFSHDRLKQLLNSTFDPNSISNPRVSTLNVSLPPWPPGIHRR